VGGSDQKHALTRTNGRGKIVEERIKALEEKYDALDGRISKLEEYAGLNDWDADYAGSSLNRRLDYLEDWRRDQND
jgi:hypothetical protein